MDSNETLGEKARWELHTNDECYFEHILEAAAHKTVAVPPISHTIQDEQDILSEKQWRIHKWRFSEDSYT